MLDATLLSKVYLKLTTGKQENLNLIENKVIDFNNNKNTEKLKESFSVPREQLMYVSNHDKKRHESFINGMTDSLWKKN